MHGFTLDLQELKKDLEAMAERAPGIVARSLNRAGVSGQTAMVKAVAADTGLQQKHVKREIRLDRASRVQPKVALTIRGRRIPLVSFGARGPEPSKGRGRGVTYRLPSGRGRIPSGFIATMKSGHRGVFTRWPGQEKSKRHGRSASRPQLPIQEKFGPSIPHVFEKKLDVFAAAAQESFLKNLRHEISFARSKEAGE
jgi:hypothetical protein